MNPRAFEPRFLRPKALGLVLFGHRGAPKLRAENTVPSFVAAWAAGADVLELDVRQSCDGQLVVLHDATLERTTDGKGPIAQWSWTKLKELRCKEPPAFGGRLEHGARLARLIDVLEALPDAPLNIDLKAVDRRGVLDVCSMLNAHTQHACSAWCAVVTSASTSVQRQIEQAPFAKCIVRGLGRRAIFQLLVRARLGLSSPGAWRGCALQIPLDTRLWGRRLNLIQPYLCTYAHASGCRIDVWHERENALIDTPELAIALRTQQIDGLFTDDIVALHQALMR